MSIVDSIRRGVSSEKVSLDDLQPPSIVELIDSVLESRTQKHSFFRPSMLKGCDRQNVFHYGNAPHSPQQHAPRMLRILDNGTAIHEVMQDYLGDHHDWWFCKESRIYEQVEGAWIRGSCDGVLIRRSDGYKVGLELKTINHNDWMKLTGPKEDHIFQASAYAILQKLRWVVFLYWDKDKQSIKEFPYMYKKEHWEALKDRVRFLKKFIDRKELPAYNPSTCNPSFCSFTEYCRKMGAPV